MPKIEEIIEKEGFIISSIKGTSMLPLLDETKDLFKATKVNRDLKVDDMVLYLNNDDIVLHRILDIKDDCLLISGDNTKSIEKVNKESVIGIVESYFKDGREVKLSDKEYLDYLNKLEKDVSKREIIYKLKGIKKDYLDFIGLIRDVIFDTNNTSTNIDYKEIYEIAAKQNLTAFIFNKIDKKYCPLSIYKDFDDDYVLAIKRKLLFDNERKEIVEEFEKKGIKYLHFKGEDFNRLYPKGTIRQFSDVDMVIEDFKGVKQLMLARGYKNNSKYVDNQYYKDFYMFEMHNFLFDDLYDKSGYFDDSFSLAIKDKDNNYGYHLDGEIYYAYLINHLHKHCITYGIGIRYFVDLYYFKKNYQLDETKVNEILEKLNIKDFHDEWMNFMNDLLYGDLKSLDVDKVNFIFSGSVYGKLSNRINHYIDEKGEVGYLIYRIIPPYSWMIRCYPWLAKVPILYPFSIVLRAFAIVFGKKRRKLALGEHREYRKLKKEERV